MAAGRAVISSVNPLGDAAKIIREAKCGFCVKPGDAEALSQAVLRVFMLSQDKESREKLERNARTYAEHNFSGVVCIRRYKEILRIAAGRAGESNEEQNVI
jgi:glycosyltransferase involved in cell wall biosynthesis